jgi:nitroreductase
VKQEESDFSNFFDLVRIRRSVRKFKSTPVADEDITRILDAARYAPTAGNQQPWMFLVLRDRKKLDKLKEMCTDQQIEAYKAHQNPTSQELEDICERVNRLNDDYFSAPVYIAVLVDSKSKYPAYNVHDGPLAAGYLMLAAAALGYGTAFLTDSIPGVLTQEVFNIPGNYSQVCITPLGIPDGPPEAPSKLMLDKLVAYDSIP